MQKKLDKTIKNDYITSMTNKTPLVRQLEAAIKREHAKIRTAQNTVSELEKNIATFEKALATALEQEQSPLAGKVMLPPHNNYSPLNEILTLLKSENKGYTLQEIVDYLVKKHGVVNRKSVQATISTLKSNRKGLARIFAEKSVSGEKKWFITRKEQHDSQPRLTQEGWVIEEKAERALEDWEGSGNKWDKGGAL